MVLGVAGRRKGAIGLKEVPVPICDFVNEFESLGLSARTELLVVQRVTYPQLNLLELISNFCNVSSQDDGSSNDVVFARPSNAASSRVSNWFSGLVDEGDEFCLRWLMQARMSSVWRVHRGWLCDRSGGEELREDSRQLAHQLDSSPEI